ncbi:hypothetical protein EDP2_3900 [Enterobacter cloacae S611]|uniref:Uncharacterized protein n=1 Tax=Enterobacter cloacae S611 TaxID=1399146 RepID=A0ABP2ZTT4_ENTCL|nr:hypothetical protein EDP2_3900 [Enterobacter cloacae S611]
MPSCGVIDCHHFRVCAVNGEEIFVALNQGKYAGGKRLIMDKESEKDGRAHQHG